jgi:hypothetical protein
MLVIDACIMEQAKKAHGGLRHIGIQIESAHNSKEEFFLLAV